MANPIIRKNLNIGAADAESDDQFLERCFVDNGDVSVLLDTSDPRCIVLGRTGAGKTALLKQVLSTADKAVEVSPEALALNYITNSNVLSFFEEAGVSLDTFYQLLWRHIIVVELLKQRFDIVNEKKQQDFLGVISGIFLKDKAKERAFTYLREWGDKFWLETEYRTKEFTNKLENDLKAKAGIDIAQIDLGVEGARKLSNEVRGEIKHRGTQIVNAVQVKELHDVIRFLADDVFRDQYQRFYLVFDRLDEGWVDDKIRFKLIKALIEAIRSFRQIHSIKIIIALRTDLHYRVIKETLHSGSQEEKYRSLYLQLRWTRDQLTEVLSKRVRDLFKRQYSNASVSLQDIMPQNQMSHRSPTDYILDRTFFRPREAIIFFNECLARSEGQTKITASVIRQAEVTYSKMRLASLADEWRRDYPRLKDSVQILSQRDYSFELSALTHDDVQRLALRMLERQDGTDDPVYQRCERFFYDNERDHFPTVKLICDVLYRVGVIGVKPDPLLGRQWSFDGAPFLEENWLKSTTTIAIHKTFWASLGITHGGNIDPLV